LNPSVWISSLFYEVKISFLPIIAKLKEKRKGTKGMKRCKKTMFVQRNLKTSIKTGNEMRKLKLRVIMPDKTRLPWKQGRVP